MRRVSSVSRMADLNKYKYEVIMDIVSRVRSVSLVYRLCPIFLLTSGFVHMKIPVEVI